MVKIIAHKTDYYSNEEFYHQVAQEEFVDGLSLNVVYDKSHELFVYSPATVENITVLNLEKHKNTHQVLSLKEVLDKIRSLKLDTLVLLNLVPMDYNVSSEDALKGLIAYNQDYVSLLVTLLNQYDDIQVQVHTISRTLLQLLEKNTNRKLGYFVHGGDLSPFDASYYVFTPNMIDDTIFQEILRLKREIFLSITGAADLDICFRHYRSKYATALSQEIFPDLNFIMAQPTLIMRIFKSE